MIYQRAIWALVKRINHVGYVHLAHFLRIPFLQYQFWNLENNQVNIQATESQLPKVLKPWVVWIY